jgi:hypothetical protein
MPLSRAEFELLQEDQDMQRDVRAVHAFLKTNSNLAYSAEEIAQPLGQPLRLVSHMLEKFDDLDLVTTDFLSRVPYYRYLKDFSELD